MKTILLAGELSTRNGEKTGNSPVPVVEIGG